MLGEWKERPRQPGSHSTTSRLLVSTKGMAQVYHAAVPEEERHDHDLRGPRRGAARPARWERGVAGRGAHGRDTAALPGRRPGAPRARVVRRRRRRVVA